MKPDLVNWDDPLAGLKRRFGASRFARIGGFMIAASIFVIGGVVAVENLPPIASIQIGGILAVALIGVPLLVVMNVRRMQLSGAFIGIKFPFREAFVVTVASMASNILPIPAGVVIRAMALKRAETSYAQVASVTMATALFWLSGVLIIAAVCFLILSLHWLSLFCALAGMGAWLLALIRVRAAGAGMLRIIELTVLQLAMVLVDAFRVFLIIAAIGVTVSYPQVGVLGLASFAGSAAGFAPGGLGVRELIAAGLGMVVSISPAVAFVGTAVNRIVGLFVVGLICAWMSFGGFSVAPTNESGHEEGQ